MEIIARPARVRYMVVGEHDHCSITDFFTDAQVCVREVYGIAAEIQDMVRVLYSHDITNERDCRGISIPASNVVEICYLNEEIAPSKGETN